MKTASVRQLQERILERKRALRAVILAHNYMVPEVQDVGDYVGDSLELSRIAARLDEQTIVFCGVSFMAETAKILSPKKRVLMPRPDAHCPMARMLNAPALKKLMADHPKAKVVCYVNSSAEVKALSHVCCTSANALKIVESVDSDEIIFVPDMSLGNYVSQFTDKKVYLSYGYCPTHHRIVKDDILALKEAHPDAVVLAHPECTTDVLNLADHIGSTSGILRFAKELPAKRFIVGTEEGLIHRLKRENPDKIFHIPSSRIVCPTMKKTQLENLLECVETEQTEIFVDEDVRVKALEAVERMLAVN
jgi:quinolinate synthase